MYVLGVWSNCYSVVQSNHCYGNVSLLHLIDHHVVQKKRRGISLYPSSFFVFRTDVCSYWFMLILFLYVYLEFIFPAVPFFFLNQVSHSCILLSFRFISVAICAVIFILSNLKALSLETAEARDVHLSFAVMTVFE